MSVEKAGGIVERLSPDTLVPYPEKNFSFELLEKQVQLADRISRVSLYTEFHERANVGLLADELQTSVRWLNSRAQSIGVRPEDTTVVPSDYVYDPMSATVLQDELWWEIVYESAAEELSSFAIADLFARSKRWVETTAADLLIFPRLVDGRRLVYPKNLIRLLRHIDLVTSPRDGWLTISEIAETVGHDDATVRKWIESKGILPEWRRSYTDARVLQRYPDATLDIIWNISGERQRAGTWRTRKTMARELGVDLDWVRPRVGPYEHLAERRVDDSGKEAWHYPESVFQVLRDAYDKLMMIPLKQEDELTVSEISRTLAMSRDTVRSRLNHLEVEPFERRTLTNKTVCCYKATILKTIGALPRDLRRP